MVSKDVSRWLMKRVGKIKLGHVGTLDPGASGVLPLLIGKATRLQDYLLELSKSYEFDLELGRETTTLDADGEEIRRVPWEHVTQAALEEALASFRGEIEQTPPLYSAVKYKGRPLYDYARADQADDLPIDSMKRRVTVTRFEMMGFAAPKASFRVDCSKGTYVRALVKDVAAKVGTCGTLTRLVRTRAAGLDLEAALSLDAIETTLAAYPGDLAAGLKALVVPTSQIDLGMPRWQTARPAIADKLRGGVEVQIELAEFFEGAKDGLTPRGFAVPVLLLGESGAAFGIGAIRQSDSGRVVVNMKRGL